ncbi:MAG TPA: DNA polymerase III subunit delta, partial [Limnochordia bacterium]
LDRLAPRGDGDARWEITRLEGGSATAGEIELALATPPLFGERRIVLVVDADLLRPAEWERLSEAVTRLPAIDPPPRLVLVADALDRRRKGVARLLTAADVVDCTQGPPRASDPRRRGERGLAAELAARAASHRIKIAPQAGALLLEAVGNDLGRLESELDKLALYVGPAGRVDERAVAELVPLGEMAAGSEVFRLVDAVGERAAGRALETLDRLLVAGENPIGILAMIARQMRLVRAALARGRDAQALAADTGVPDFVARKVVAQARRFTLDEAEAALSACLACDLDLKSGIEPRGALQSLIVRLARPD